MKLYISDSDHVTLHQHQHHSLVSQITRRNADELAITVITVEEQMRGRLAQIGRPGVPLEAAYSQLLATVSYFCGLKIVPFDSTAQQLYLRLRAEKIRVGTLDLRIAAVALSQNAVVVTRNQKDFRQVPGLMLEDWSQAS